MIQIPWIFYCVKTVAGGCDFTFGDIVHSTYALCEVGHMKDSYEFSYVGVLVLFVSWGGGRPSYKTQKQRHTFPRRLWMERLWR